MIPRIVVSEWQSLCYSRGLRADPAQRAVASILDSVVSLQNGSDGKSGCFIHGTVGTGKTLLLDCFHRVLHPKSKRIHFHDFMLGVHESLHQTKCMDETIAIMATQSKCLCFDEFQVTDVADAVLLHRLFKGLFDDHGVFVVATSNRAPEKLYENGINREALFVPFQHLLRERCEIIDINELGASIDYRTVVSEGPQGILRQASILYPIVPGEIDAIQAALCDVSPCA